MTGEKWWRQFFENMEEECDEATMDEEAWAAHEIRAREEDADEETNPNTSADPDAKG